MHCLSVYFELIHFILLHIHICEAEYPLNRVTNSCLFLYFLKYFILIGLTEVGGSS